MRLEVYYKKLKWIISNGDINDNEKITEQFGLTLGRLLRQTLTNERYLKEL